MIVNYYVKFSLDDLSNENKNTGVSREMVFQKYVVHFGNLIHVLSWNIYFRLLRRKHTENQQLFDRIIDITLFDGVEGLDY